MVEKCRPCGKKVEGEERSRRAPYGDLFQSRGGRYISTREADGAFLAALMRFTNETSGITGVQRRDEPGGKTRSHKRRVSASSRIPQPVAASTAAAYESRIGPRIDRSIGRVKPFFG